MVRTGQTVGMAFPEFEALPQSDLGKGDRRSVSGYERYTRLDCNKQQQITDLIYTYGDIFCQECDQLPTIKVPVEHAIRLKPNATLQWARPRRLAPDVRKEVRKRCLIRGSSSPWAAPIVTARRKNGNLRLAIDYRRLNGLAQPRYHPLPLIDDLVDQLTDAKFFSTVDLKSGYYQMQMREEEASKTSFVTPDGQYEWTGQGTPFGLSGAPATFQRLMTAALSDLNWTAALCYLDEVLVWGRTWKEHTDRLEAVLNKLQKAGALLNPNKCCFGVLKVEFLGHVIIEGTMQLSEARTSALINTPHPCTVTML